MYAYIKYIKLNQGKQEGIVVFVGFIFLAGGVKKE